MRPKSSSQACITTRSKPPSRRRVAAASPPLRAPSTAAGSSTIRRTTCAARMLNTRGASSFDDLNTNNTRILHVNRVFYCTLFTHPPVFSILGVRPDARKGWRRQWWAPAHVAGVHGCGGPSWQARLGLVAGWLQRRLLLCEQLDNKGGGLRRAPADQTGRPRLWLQAEAGAAATTSHRSSSRQHTTQLRERGL